MEYIHSKGKCFKYHASNFFICNKLFFTRLSIPHLSCYHWSTFWLLQFELILIFLMNLLGRCLDVVVRGSYIYQSHCLVFVAAVNAGKIIAYWDLPLVSFSSVDPALADKNMYNTLVRIVSPYNRMADAMVELFNYYQVCTH